MDIEEIRKNAPIGANFYSLKTNEYLRGENGDFDLWLNGVWRPITIELDFSVIGDMFEIKPLN